MAEPTSPHQIRVSLKPISIAKAESNFPADTPKPHDSSMS